MFNLAIGLGVVLLLAILFLIFRISSLIGVAKGNSKKVATGSNRFNGAFFMVFLIGAGILFFWYSFKEYNNYQLPVASAHGSEYEFMFWLTMGVTGVVFILTQILLFYFAWKYQYKSDSKALFYPENNKLEVAWTFIPAVVLAVLVFTGWRVWSDITSPAPENTNNIEIMGYQFAWDVRYPGLDGELGNYDYMKIDAVNSFGIDFTDKAAYDDFTYREMVIPKGEPVTFNIRAKDVLHSVFAPHFRLKMDAVPGMPTSFTFTATKTTEEMREELNDPEFNYEIACTEVCGKGHFSMKKNLVVLEPEAYREWYKEQESFLKRNPDYLSEVPSELKEMALLKTGIDNNELAK
ncbi:cytochrome c oxidase subunit II [Marivirga atlantica]|jgi:cytochrome c oxidase subunit 2|uniref:Cytochrome c oxidase subunit 2 n=1 Tax=Marivirga atlantica TaxID=1548457 RepID=A0A937A835_9BACT|nr:cytochrome c oxidase subunit II [Marivirga atlantica]MBL0765325.1 cytochrome c oxidase subunit II [Marivirga atlantica]